MIERRARVSLQTVAFCALVASLAHEPGQDEETPPSRHPAGMVVTGEP